MKHNPVPHSERSGKALIDATRPFAKEDIQRSWFYVATTFLLLAITTAVGLWAPWWPLQLLASVIGGGLVVRGFILYHDFLHSALLRKSKLGRWLMYAYGVYVLNPPRVWRQTHNYHHAHNAKLVGSHIGSFATLSVDMYLAATPAQRLKYRITRHPLTVALGYFTIFLYGMCISSFLRSPARCWDSMVAVLLQVALAVGVTLTLGWEAYLFGIWLPLFLGCAMGSYLFYAQHNFPGVSIQPREEWSYTRASLESSSFMPMGPLMTYFTGNIGYHHVHHLNPSIPFYRLPEAMAAIPELQNPRVTTLSPQDVIACFALKLWDPTRRRMVGYPVETEADQPLQKAA